MNRCLSTSKFVALQVFALLLFAATLFGQETTAGLQGTVKDTSGAVISGAQVVVTGNTLVGDKKSTKTDGNGYYHFANIPPGTYSVTVKAEGFATCKERTAWFLKRATFLRSILSLQVGKTETIVEVSGETPAIDVTTNHTMTNITQDVIEDVPHGRSFQSVIQFAPSARNEPLQGNNIGSATEPAAHLLEVAPTGNPTASRSPVRQTRRTPTSSKVRKPPT